ADAVSVANTFVGMAVDWRRRRPVLANGTGGAGGAAIKPPGVGGCGGAAGPDSLPGAGAWGLGTGGGGMGRPGGGACARRAGAARGVALGPIRLCGAGGAVRVGEPLAGGLGPVGGGGVREVIGTLAVGRT